MAPLRGTMQPDDKRGVSRLAHRTLEVSAASHGGKVVTYLYKNGDYIVREETDDGTRQVATGNIGTA